MENNQTELKPINKIKMEKFTFNEKFFAQFTYNAGVMIASYGLYLNNPSFGIGYLLSAYMGIFLMVRYTICARCPHLHVGNDCVQLPAPIMKKLVSNRKGPLNIYEKTLFIIVLYGTFVFPLYWLFPNIWVFVPFLILYGGHLLALDMHFCKNCKNKTCIKNKEYKKGEYN